MTILSKSSLCPSCGSHGIYKSRRKGLFEHILYTVFFFGPFRCGACDLRYFRSRLSVPPAEKPHHHAA